jgi:hypothetical protein
MISGRVEVAAGKWIRVDDHPVEDPIERHHVLDDADAVAVAIVDRGPVPQCEVRDLGAEILWRRRSLLHWRASRVRNPARSGCSLGAQPSHMRTSAVRRSAISTPTTVGCAGRLSRSIRAVSARAASGSEFVSLGTASLTDPATGGDRGSERKPLERQTQQERDAYHSGSNGEHRVERARERVDVRGVELRRQFGQGPWVDVADAACQAMPGG